MNRCAVQLNTGVGAPTPTRDGCCLLRQLAACSLKPAAIFMDLCLRVRAREFVYTRACYMRHGVTPNPSHVLLLARCARGVVPDMRSGCGNVFERSGRRLPVQQLVQPGVRRSFFSFGERRRLVKKCALWGTVLSSLAVAAVPPCHLALRDDSTRRTKRTLLNLASRARLCHCGNARYIPLSAVGQGGRGMR